MIDPLAEMVTLLQPSARFSKVVVGAGPWHIQRADAGQPWYCVMLEGSCRVEVDRQAALTLQSGDFLLVPASWRVVMSSQELPTAGIKTLPVDQGNGVFRIGNHHGPTDLRMLIGHCRFDSPDADLLVALLPQRVHVRGQSRLATLMSLVGEESRGQRPAREVVLARLLEVLLIEALRSNTDTTGSPGLVRGLADERLALAIRAMHAQPERSWTVAQLASEAALSRSAFFERFNRVVGVAPMAYLLAWRMALAKHLLRQNKTGIAAIAERIGYSSASTFSAAFTRHVGQAPTHYARSHADSPIRKDDALDVRGAARIEASS